MKKFVFVILSIALILSELFISKGWPEEAKNQADHFSFADNPTAWLFPSKSRPDVQRISKAMMVLFCDHFLKEKKEAKAKMNTEYANSLCGNVVTKIQWHEK